MNQNRWTCLTTLVLTAVIAPITSVNSKTLPSPVVKSVDNYSPLSPHSLPTITPLVVTELQTDAAIPAAVQTVPQVSKLPTFTKIAVNNKSLAASKQRRATKIGIVPTKNKNVWSQFPVVKLPIKTTLFNPQSQLTKSILAVADQTELSPATVNSVIPLPLPIAIKVAKPQPTPFITKTASAPIPVVRSSDTSAPIENRAPSSHVETTPATAINNSATVQAEIADIPAATNMPQSINITGNRVATIGTKIDRNESNSTPQVAPIVGNPNNVHTEGLRQRSDLPSFEAGLPVFVFENERPQQIVATAIAQVGETIVAPEPSIAIPVERPKQLTVPSQLPVTTVPTTPAAIPTVTAVPSVPALKPNGMGIVKIEQPSETVRPALDKIVATQSGQASWYGREGGPRTANGERYYPEGLTAAHRTLPFGTKVRVTSLKTGKTVTVRINDRGPFHGRRIIDISAGAARVIGLKSDGVGAVRMDILAKEKSGQE